MTIDTSTAAVMRLMDGVTQSLPGNMLHVNKGQVWKTGEAWRVIYDVPESLAQRHVAVFDSEKDARFFAAARDLVPALLAERDALTARAEAAEAALKEGVEDAKLYQEIAEEIGGCGDGGCIIHRPGGMHTNGGCRCAMTTDRERQRGIQRLLTVAYGLTARLAKHGVSHDQ